MASSSLPLQQQLDGDDEVATAEAAIPAAEPVERGRLLVGEEEEDGSEEQTWNNTPNGVVSPTTTTTRQQLPRQQRQEECLFDGRDDAPASPDSFNADELFENILIGDSNDDDNTRSGITDQDLENLLSEGSLLPSRRTVRTTLETSTEDDDDDDDDDNSSDNDNNDNVHNNDQQSRMRRYRKKRNVCDCCSTAATRLSCSSSNYSYVGNMIIVLPKCYYNSRLRFGIIGPHWYVSYSTMIHDFFLLLIDRLIFLFIVVVAVIVIVCTH